MMEPKIDIARFAELLSGHSTELGQRYVAHGDDWAEMGFDYDPRFAMQTTTGILASGPIISLIDSVSSFSIIAKIKRFRPMATLDLRIDYLRSAPPGRAINARATCYRVTRNVAFVRCEAHDGDPADPIALSMSSFFFTGD